MIRWSPVLACAAVAAVGAAAVDAPPSGGTAGQAVAGPVAVVAPPPHADDPFPIRRLRATPAQFPELQKQLGPGPLVRLPRDEFESRVRAAGRAVAAAGVVPRVADARYAARLTDGDLDGSAELEVVNAGPLSQFLTLDPFRLAPGPATWADGREAVVGVPAGGTAAGVWVDRPGRQTLRFRWSAAGITEPGERRFELRVPPAPTAALELDLPAGQVPATTAADVLLTGPFPVAGDPARAAWRFRFGGRALLDFAVRPAGNPGVPVAAALGARYDLSPGQLACSFEYDLRPAKGTVGEWAFTVDPGLRVTDVVVNNRAGWVIDPPTAPGSPRRLRVTLRQPGAGGKVLVAAVAPFPDPTRPADAPLPVVRPVGAHLDDETVEVRLAPGLRPEGWSPGDYRLTDAQTLPDQTRVLTLVGTLAPPGADLPFRRPPSVRTSATDNEFTTVEQVAWRLGPDRVSAVVKVGVRVRRGPLFQVTVRPPAGYVVARVTAAPDDLLSHHATAAGVATAEFARPLGAGQYAEVTFEFRGPPLPAGGTRLAFPAFPVVGAAERVGVLGVVPGPLWAADLEPGAGAARVGWFDAADPRPPAEAAVAYRYRGTDPGGWLAAAPARPELAVATVTTAGGRAETTRFELAVRSGAVAGVAVYEPGGVPPGGRTWAVTSGGNAVAAAVPVPVAVFARSAPGARPVVWAVRFARPATGPLTLETTAAGVAGPTRLSIPGAAEQTHSGNPGPAAEPGVVQPVLPTGWSLAGLYLVTAVRSPDDVEVVFGGTVRSIGGSALPLALPAGAEVRAVAVGARWLAPGGWRTRCEDAGTVLDVPVHATGQTRFEVRYRVPSTPVGPARVVRSPEPGLPVAGEVRRWWAFAPGVLPGWPVRAWDRGTAADFPPFLGEPPADRADAVVSRSPVEEVRVGTARAAEAAGAGAAAVLFVLAWAGGRRRHPFCAVLAAGGLLIAGVVAVLGPPWWERAAAVPLVAGSVGVAGMVVARGLRAAAGVAAMVIACSLTGGVTTAQPTAAALVVILPADGVNGGEVVVAPKAVLDRLAAVSRPASPGVVLTAAEYSVTADEATARVVAKVVAHAPPGSAPVAVLPLADARLERVTVGGAAAFPTSPRPGVYHVPLPGPGRHEVEVRFAVPVGANGPERDVRFGVPEVPATRVTLDLPGAARQVQVAGRAGKQTTAAGDARVRVEADAGAVKVVQARWRDGAGGAAAVKVREGCVWDVTEAGAELTACYLVRVEQGTISTLRFELPADLTPLGVTVRPLDKAGTAALRDWTAGPEKGATRTLRVDFQGPTAGRALVVLTCSPSKSVTRQPVLRFPRVIVPGGAAEPDASYGLRAKGVVVEDLARGGVIDFSPEALTRDFPDVAKLQTDPGAPTRVFRTAPGGTPELRPTLRPAAEQPAVTLDTTWHVGPHRADAAGTVAWSGKDAPAVLEFALPGVRVAEVRGADVAGWSQTGVRVQVWFRKPAKEGEFSWDGTVVPSPPTKPPPVPLPFDAVTPRVADARLAGDAVRVHPIDGWATGVERDRGWTAAPGAAHTFRTTSPTALPVRVLLTARPAARPTAVGQPTPARPGAGDPPAAPTGPAVGAAPARPPASSAPAPPEADVRWVWPVSAALGWAGVVAGLVVLTVRFPHATWPEQFGLVAGLFGAAVVGCWWVGLAGWGAARVAWLLVPRSGAATPAA